MQKKNKIKKWQSTQPTIVMVCFVDTKNVDLSLKHEKNHKMSSSSNFKTFSRNRHYEPERKSERKSRQEI